MSGGYGIPVKQQQHNFPPQMLYQKQQLPYFDPAPVKSSKYADLFINPVAPPSSYSFGVGGGVDVYPVDVTNSIPDTSNTHKLNSLPDQQTPSNNTSADLESMVFGKSDMDFGSLLSMLTPDNKLDDTQTTDSSSYLIPSLDFLSEPSPQQQQQAKNGGYEMSSTAAASVQPFGSYGLENSNSIPVMSDEQTFWDGVDKLNTTSTAASSVGSAESAVSIPLSLDMASPMDDPFMAGLLGDEPSLSFPADDSRYYQTATPTSDIFQAGLAGEQSPPTVSGQSSPITPASGSGGMASASWDDNLQDLFEKTVDISDMMELDFMLPPPTKRRPEAGLTLHSDIEKKTENAKVWPTSDPAPREVKVEPVSPQEVKSPSLTPSPGEVVDAMSERGGGGKSKSTILFGKHEDDIIHKLLAPQPGAQNKPVSRDKLVSMPVEEFNQMLEQACLSEIEVAFMKEWRRRGKNKAAAQIARKRKREEVTDLEGEVKALRKQKAELNKKYDRLRSQIASLKKRSMAAEDRVYRQQTRLTGKAVSRDTHQIHLTDDDKLLLVPIRISSQVLTINK